MLSTHLLRDALEVQVQITGAGEQSATCVLAVSDLKDTPAALRLTDVVYSVEGGQKVSLWWEDDSGESLILPLEGRGFLDLDKVGGIHNPRRAGWTGHVLLSAQGEGLFFVGLQFTKVRV